MKKYYTTALLCLTLGFLQAQNYTFSLDFITTNTVTGNYQFSLTATPDFEQIVDAPTADMGVVIYIPSGYTLGNFTSGNSNLQSFEWTNSNENSYDGNVTDLIQLLRTDIVSNNFTHIADQPIELVFFEIISDAGDGNNPTTGAITLAENSDPNVIPNFYESYININLQDGNGTQDYFGGHNSASNSIDFETLSISNNTALEADITIYPNPTHGIVNINSNHTIDIVEVYSILGHKVATFNNSSLLDVSPLKSGVYLLKIIVQGKIRTKKIVIR